jgi:hypothetical protein
VAYYLIYNLGKTDYPASNYTNVSFAIYLASTNNQSYSGYNGQTISWNVGGNTGSAGVASALSCAGGATPLIASGSYNIGHNVNGALGTVSASASFDGSGGYAPPDLSASNSIGTTDYDRSANAPTINTSYRNAAGTTSTIISDVASAKNGGPAATDYNYQWSTNNSSWSGDIAMGSGRVATLSVGKTTAYWYRARAINSDGGWSAYGASAGPFYGFASAPRTVTATPSSSITGRINLSWVAPETTSGGITGYRIYRRISGGTYALVATTTGVGTTYTDEGLTRGTLYDYYITAKNAVSDAASGESDASTAVTSVLAPGIPSAPTLSTVDASTDTFGKVTLTWTKPTNTGGGIVDYYLYADGVVKTSVTGENTLSGSITGLNPRQTYSFTVRGRNQFSVDNGTPGDTSNTINRKSPGPPTAPTSLTADAPFSPPGTVDLEWVAPSDVGAEGATITGYTVYLAGQPTPIKTTTGTGTSTTIEDLVPATSYTFNVRARNEIADTVGTFSVASNSVTATAQGEPEAPTGLTVVSDPLVAGRLVLTWTPPVGYNTGFRVYTGADVLVANVSTPRLEIDGLTPNTSYSYKVRARNPLTDLTSSPGGPASTTVAGLVGATSTQTVPSISVTNNTNTTFVGTFPLVSTTATTMSYSKTASNIAFASVPVSGGSTVNNTNTNLNGSGAYTVTAPTTTSITFTRAGSDIPANTSTPSGTMTNSTNATFNGSYTVLGSPAPDPLAKTVSYTRVSSDITSRAASGVITNNSNAIFNGEHIITDVTETTILYPRVNDDIAESNAFGVAENKTNKDIFNGSFTLSDTPDHKTIEYSTGDLTYGENLITNPSMEFVQSGSTTLRTNLCVNPSFETNVTGWTGTSASIARSGAYAHSGTYSGLVTPGSTSGYVSAIATTVSGQAHRLSAWVYAEEATTLRMSVVSPATTGATFNVLADTWTRINVSFTSNTTTTTYSVETVGSTQPFYIDDVLLEQTSELRPHFDGGTADSLGWDYGWTGTANASTSTAKATAATLRTNLMTNPNIETNTTGWVPYWGAISRVSTSPQSGSWCLRVDSDGDGDTSFSFNSTSGLVAGTSYRAGVWVRAEAGPKTVSLFLTAGGSSSSITFDATTSWQFIQAPAVVANGANFSISFQAFGFGVGIFVDSAIVETTSTYAGSFFDGNTAAGGGYTYAWTGTANASTSTLAGTQTAPVGLSRVSSVVVSTYALSHSGSLSALVSPSSNTGGASLTQTTVAGTVYTFSAWVYSDAAKNMKLTADSTVGTTVLVPAATWTRLNLSFTAEDTSTLLSILGTDSIQAFYIDDIMLQESSTLDPYFDGDTDATATTWPVVYSWAGTPHASISTREVGETLPEVGAEILAPYGAASREQSDAQLQIRYRSGWLG